MTADDERPHGEAAVLTFNDVGHLDVADAWRRGHRLVARIVDVVSEDDDFALAQPYP
jgi:hypothetical protein